MRKWIAFISLALSLVFCSVLWASDQDFDLFSSTGWEDSIEPVFSGETDEGVTAETASRAPGFEEADEGVTAETASGFEEADEGSLTEAVSDFGETDEEASGSASSVFEGADAGEDLFSSRTTEEEASPSESDAGFAEAFFTSTLPSDAGEAEMAFGEQEELSPAGTPGDMFVTSLYSWTPAKRLTYLIGDEIPELTNFSAYRVEAMDATGQKHIFQNEEARALVAPVQAFFTRDQISGEEKPKPTGDRYFREGVYYLCVEYRLPEGYHCSMNTMGMFDWSNQASVWCGENDPRTIILWKEETISLLPITRVELSAPDLKSAYQDGAQIPSLPFRLTAAFSGDLDVTTRLVVNASDTLGSYLGWYNHIDEFMKPWYHEFRSEAPTQDTVFAGDYYLFGELQAGGGYAFTTDCEVYLEGALAGWNLDLRGWTYGYEDGSRLVFAKPYETGESSVIHRVEFIWDTAVDLDKLSSLRGYQIGETIPRGSFYVDSVNGRNSEKDRVVVQDISWVVDDGTYGVDRSDLPKAGENIFQQIMYYLRIDLVCDGELSEESEIYIDGRRIPFDFEKGNSGQGAVSLFRQYYTGNSLNAGTLNLDLTTWGNGYQVPCSNWQVSDRMALTFFILGNKTYGYETIKTENMNGEPCRYDLDKDGHFDLERDGGYGWRVCAETNLSGNYTVDASAPILDQVNIQGNFSLFEIYEKMILTFPQKPPVKVTPIVTPAKTSYVYTGKVIHPKVTVSLPDGTILPSSGYTLSYSDGCVNVGTYTIKATLKGAYKGSGTAAFSITKRSIAKAAVRLGRTSFVYTGKQCKPKVYLSIRDLILRAGSDYLVTYANNIDVGTATATAKGIGNFKGTVQAAFKITKAPQPMTVTTKIVNLKYSVLKRTQVVVGGAKVFVIRNNQGKVSFLKLSGSSHAVVNTKNGDLLVKKGTKKGTYKIKVRVTAKGNKNYKAGSRTVTVTINVS